jgi:hypothetical protein
MLYEILLEFIQLFLDMIASVILDKDTFKNYTSLVPNEKNHIFSKIQKPHNFEILKKKPYNVM